MAKALVIDYEKCTGCQTCEMACSIKHEEVNHVIWMVRGNSEG